MKSTTKMTILAAALAVVSGVASAQPMKANIPFSFRFGGNVYAAGSYTVDVRDANMKVFLYNRDTRTGAIALPQSPVNPAPEWIAKGDPVLEFTCGSSRCELSRLWTGGGHNALAMRHHKLGRDEVATIRLIPLSRSNGE